MLEIIEPLWGAAPEFKIRLLVLVVLAQMVLAVRLYSVMSKNRFRAAKAGEVNVEVYRATQNEPERLAVFSRAVSNQFEAPVMFYAVIAMSMALGVVSWLTVILAIAYVALRWAHANEMIGEHVVLKRRAIFVRSFQVLLALMAEFAISAMIWA